jgi:hypothetical protein
VFKHPGPGRPRIYNDVVNITSDLGSTRDTEEQAVEIARTILATMRRTLNKLIRDEVNALGLDDPQAVAYAQRRLEGLQQWEAETIDRIARELSQQLMIRIFVRAPTAAESDYHNG